MSQLYVILARKLAWDPTPAYVDQKSKEIQRCLDALPSGSGWDTGTTIDESKSNGRIVLYGSFHHMDEYGSYDGWTDHTITVKPSLAYGFELTISGKNRNGIKDYLHELFDWALRQEIPEWGAAE